MGIKFTGTSILRYRGNRIDLTPSTVAYLPKEKTRDIDYTTTTTEFGNGVCIFFDSSIPLPTEPQMLKNAGREVEDSFLKLLNIYTRQDKYAYPDVMTAFYELLSKLNRSGRSSIEQAVSRFAPALSYMSEHWNDEYLDIGKMALICGMSEKYFRDSFSRIVGISPLQFFHRQKVHNIRRLISDLSLSVSAVAHLSGFSDPNYFSRFFKKHFGISPIEYRSYYCKI